jgi:hypothetical protein
MTARRSNRGGARHEYGLPLETIEKPLRERAKRWHWGISAKQVINWRDGEYPDRMIEIGRLCELHVLPVGASKRSIVMPIPKRWWFDFPEGVHAPAARGAPQPRKLQAHVAFDPSHKYQRIYLLMPDALQRDFKPLFRRDASIDLNALAQHVGGRQGVRDYPRMMVTPIGTLTHIVYYTAKKGDDNNPGGDPRSQYIHELGEESGLRPMLAVDSRGRLWLAGGNYKAPVPGIMD